jgi:hypothetical protein
MWFSSLLQSVKSNSAGTHRRAQSTARRKRSVRPQVETLEDRTVPSFASPVAIGSYDFASLMTADANGDGKPDIVAMSSPNVGGVGLEYLSNGNGTFVQGRGCFDWGAQIPTAMAVGDVNGDGKLDFVFANRPSNYPTNYPTPVTVTVGLGNAQGGFTPAIAPFGQEAILPGPVSSLTLADVYGNGKLDIVAVANSGGAVYVARNGGTGIFGTAQSYFISGRFGVSPTPPRVTVADLNGDGKPDIIVTDPGFNSVSVLMNNSNGTFAPAQAYFVGANPTAVAVGDFNRDGKLDIVTANSNGTVSVLMNSGAGAFGAASSYALGGPANSVAVGDFNHDGYVDIATTGSTEMDVLMNDGNGAFGPDQKVGPAGTSIVAADFNGDAFPDLAELVGSSLSFIKSIDVIMNKADWMPGPVAPSFGGITYNSHTNVFSEVVTLTNKTNSAITGPQSLKLTNLPSGATLTDATGTTSGSPYIHFLNSGKTLMAGASTTITLTFTAPSLGDIAFGTELEAL